MGLGAQGLGQAALTLQFPHGGLQLGAVLQGEGASGGAAVDQRGARAGHQDALAGQQQGGGISGVRGLGGVGGVRRPSRPEHPTSASQQRTHIPLEHLTRRPALRLHIGRQVQQPPGLVVQQGHHAALVHAHHAVAHAVQQGLAGLMQGGHLLRLRPVDPCAHVPGGQRRSRGPQRGGAEHPGREAEHHGQQVPADLGLLHAHRDGAHHLISVPHGHLGPEGHPERALLRPAERLPAAHRSVVGRHRPPDLLRIRVRHAQSVPVGHHHELHPGGALGQAGDRLDVLRALGLVDPPHHLPVLRHLLGHGVHLFERQLPGAHILEPQHHQGHRQHGEQHDRQLEQQQTQPHAAPQPATLPGGIHALSPAVVVVLAVVFIVRTFLTRTYDHNPVRSGKPRGALSP